MIVFLPDDDKVDLPNHKHIEERMYEVENLIDKYQEYVDRNPTSPKVVYFLNGLSNYLIWYKDEEDELKHDKEVLSKLKMKRMKKYDKRNINFSSMSKKDLIDNGIVDDVEEVE